MPVSTNPDWTQTVGHLCRSAAVELGAIGIGDELEASEELEMIVRLNSMMAKWATEANLFRQASTTITVGATGQLTLDSEISNIRSARHVQSPTNSRWIAPWTRDQFYLLPNRAQTGASPMAYYLSRQVGAPILYVWPVPTANISIELDYDRAFFFAEGPEQEVDLPQEWHETLLYGLAARCANMFGASDPVKVQRIDAQAKATYDKMLDSDRPDSYYFEYDSPVEAR